MKYNTDMTEKLQRMYDTNDWDIFPTMARKPPREEPSFFAYASEKILHQHQGLKDDLFESLLILIEYPLVKAPVLSASNPAPSDVSGFQMHVRLFQPADIDVLTDERNAIDMCGYALCPEPRRKLPGKGTWKLMSNGDILARQEYEKWCSTACAERASLVKSQLVPIPAWKRTDNPSVMIDVPCGYGPEDLEAFEEKNLYRDRRAVEVALVSKRARCETIHLKEFEPSKVVPIERPWVRPIPYEPNPYDL